MMARTPAREQHLNRLSIRWTVTLILVSLGGGFLLGLGQSLKQPWLQGMGVLGLSAYVLGFLVFVWRYQQMLDERVRQRNLEAAALGLTLLMFSALVYLLAELVGLKLPHPSVAFLLFYGMALYLGAYIVLWWRSR